MYAFLWPQFVEWLIFSGEAWAMAMGMTKPWIATIWEELPEEKREEKRQQMAERRMNKESEMFAMFTF